MTTAPIKYDLPAALHKWPSLERRRVANGDMIHAGQVYEGSLAGCVREFMAKPISKRPLYEIFTDKQPGLSNSILQANDIVEIAERNDFPKD